MKLIDCDSTKLTVKHKYWAYKYNVYQELESLITYKKSGTIMFQNIKDLSPQFPFPERYGWIFVEY